ncbi:MAG: lysophospholipid acyltransferase family protein [Wenzhouxiangella sp.]
MKLQRIRRRWTFHLLRWLASRLASGGMESLRHRGERFGRWHYRLSWRQRRRLIPQIQRALAMPDRHQAAELLAEAFAVNDRAVLEILAMYSGAVVAEEVSRVCEIRGLDTLDQALEQGRGVVLLGLHMGNGVAMATSLAQRGYPVHVVFRESGKISPGFFENGLTGLGIQAVNAKPPGPGLRRMLTVLKRNGVLFILMDQGMKQGGVEANLLGKRLNMPPGPAELARRSGAAIVPALMEGASPRWQFRLDEARSFDRDTPLEEAVANLTQIMQKQIEKQPQWWTWHQRRWARHPFID